MEQKGLDFGAAEPARPAPRRAFTVSELTDRVQGVLETDFFDVWVEGEVSNLRFAPSGHWYFSLKDDHAQLKAVVWKTATRLIRFRPRDGMKVVVRGGLRVYPPRGEYQLSVEVLEPLGKGTLQQAFEELKEKLEKEGLFDGARKRPLPMLPRCIGVVTSPSGAVIQDILRVVSRRYANLEVLVYPARVQGEDAAAEIVQGIRALNRLKGLDVIIVARGGGSLEDLWPFNEERVARALAASRVPTISAVGHETDYTIADFVADLRAPTPSAAAEHVIQAKDEICARIDALARRQHAALSLTLARVRSRVGRLASHRVFEAERGRVRNHAQRVDELQRRAETSLRRRLERARDRVRGQRDRVEAFRWDRQIALRREQVARHVQRLRARAGLAVDGGRGRLSGLAGKLDSLSPLAVLSRGYALVWNEQGRLVREPAEVRMGEALRLRVRGGGLGAVVTSKDEA
ncbi:MAG: exodeoxyribonuclease VII large subunit [Acidobacteria bacterium]|nr:MAG: exodeoxyribonuclease VII large subunit [Acidobacteriota bacterium]PYQ23216.1 MAG: exodeoxyribonuclease VII large subunit [Acidobacteriota bacterium]